MSFDYIRENLKYKKEITKGKKFLIKCSMVEIYYNEVKDLLIKPDEHACKLEIGLDEFGYV